MAKSTAKRVSLNGKWRYRGPSGKFISRESYKQYKQTEQEFREEKAANKTVNATRDRNGKLRKQGYRPRASRDLVDRLAEFIGLDPYAGSIPKPDVSTVQGVKPHLVHTYKWYFRTAEGVEAAESLNLRLSNYSQKKLKSPPAMATVNIGSGFGKHADWVSSPWLILPELHAWFQTALTRPSIAVVIEENAETLWVEYSLLSPKKVTF